MRSGKILFLLLCASCLMQKAYADDVLTHVFKPAPEEATPWFTGPIVAPSVHTIPKGHVDIEPYLFLWAFTGAYNNRWRPQAAQHNFYSLQLQVPVWFGVCSFLDVTVQPIAAYQFTQNQQSLEFGDLPFAVDIQLLNEDQDRWWVPAIKLALSAVGPTGKYDNLNLSPRLAFSYTVPNPLHVKNYNAYGGTYGTNGTVYPGNAFSFDFGLEYNLSQNWVIANDFYYQHNNKYRFSGNTGFVEPGVPALMTSPSSDQFSLAPAIEYNWSQNIGIIGGVWFTFAGRNASRFVTGVIAFNVYI
jgi:hypothetical protein